MATQTPNLNLVLPDYSDKADVGVINDNFKKIDNFSGGGKVDEWLNDIQEKADESLAKISQDATSYLKSIQTEATESLSEIDTKAKEVFDSIPDDYEQVVTDVSSLKDCKADAILDTSARAAAHTLHAQRGRLGVTLYGKTTETGTGDKSPDNPYEISGVDAAWVNAGGNEISMLLLPDGSPLMGNGTVDDTVENDVLSGCDKKIVLDGSEDWAGPSSAGNYTLGGFSGLPAVRSEQKHSNRYATFTGGSWNDLADKQFGTNMSVIYVQDKSLTTLEDFKAALQANPLTVYYRSTDYTPDKDLMVCRTVRKWKTVTLDGSKDEAYDTTGAAFFITPTQKAEAVSAANVLGNVTSDWLPTGTAQNAHQGTPCISIRASGALQFCVDGVTDVDTLRTYLAENPLEVTYALATPETYMTDPLPLRKPDTLTTDTVTVTGSGETAVSYPHDTKHYIDSKISELVTLALANN